MTKNSPDSMAVQGGLLLLQAKVANDPKQGQHDATSAATLLEKAIKLNSLLRKEFEPLLKEAQALSRNTEIM